MLTEHTLALLAGLIGGIVSGLLGFGGGSLIPPFLALTLGVSQHAAQGISLAALLPPVGWPAVRAYRSAGIRISSGLVWSLVAGFVCGAAVGGFAAQAVSGPVLRLGFAVFLVVNALRTLLLLRVPARDEPDTERELGFSLTGVAAGALGGIVTGLIGVGGGLVVGPLLRRWLKLPALQAQAVTLAMMLPPIGLPAVAAYAWGQGGLPWPLLGAVALGFLIGSGIGARFALRAPARWLSVAYAALLLLTAALLMTVRSAA